VNRRQWRVLRSNKTALFGGCIIVCFALVAIFANLIATHDPELRQDDLLAPPSAEYLLGTDPNGFDVFSRLVYGTRSSLLTALAAVGLALLVGLPLGLVAGWHGRWIDSVIMRCVDVMLAFPAVLLAVAIAAALGEPSPSPSCSCRRSSARCAPPSCRSSRSTT
jgi:peptide/nickel transport system permease protein